MNRKALIYGTLIFVLGIAMVACGDKSSSNSAAPAQQQTVVDGFPVVSTNGQIGNSNCNGSSGCILNVEFRVTNSANFIRMVGSQQFGNGIIPSSIDLNTILNTDWTASTTYTNWLQGLLGACGPTWDFINSSLQCGSVQTNNGTVNTNIPVPQDNQTLPATATYFEAFQRIDGTITYGGNSAFQYNATLRRINGSNEQMFIDEQKKVFIRPVTASQMDVYTLDISNNFIPAGTLFLR